MLERFRVPADIAVRVQEKDLRSTVEDVFRKMGMSEQHSVQAADVLILADLRAVETHGVSNMLRIYVEQFGRGHINPRPQPKIVRESVATANIDGDRGLGCAIAPDAMRLAIEKADKCGVGAVTMTNGRHYGMSAYYAMQALEHDMIGLSMTVGGTVMAPTWGAKRMLGANPLGIAAPGRNEPPFVFDASTTSVAGNKVDLAKRLGQKLLPAWIAGPDGVPVMEEAPPPEDWWSSMLLPLGGTREIGSHKGYGLAVMIDVLSGILSGTGPGFMNQGVASHHFLAYKIEAFVDVDWFKDTMDAYMKALTETPPATGHDRVVYAGLPEHEDCADRMKNGIPLHPEVVDWFRSITSELDIPWRLTPN